MGLVINHFTANNPKSGNAIKLDTNGGNLIAGNFIGTDVSGTQALGNSVAGVLIGCSANNVIGGTSASARNVISGNNLGVWFTCSPAPGNLVQGNFIGTNVTGANRIGGLTALARNVISGNRNFGVQINHVGARDNEVLGNYIGTDVTGSNAMGNALVGVLINGAPDNAIGQLGGGAVRGNVISGNLGGGILIFGIGNGHDVMTGNFIGTDAGGTAPLGNGGHGVIITGGMNTDNRVGENTIAFNAGTGVVINGGTGNLIFRNSIHDNAGLGIDLGNDGVTANDHCDQDNGSNKQQNFPDLTSSTTTMIQGQLDSAVSPSPYVIEFFASPACDPSGFGEGRVFLGSTPVNIAPSQLCTATFTFQLMSPVPSGWFITATARHSPFGTSEFSRCVRVSG